MLVLKIISFPVRFAFFALLGLLSLALLIFQNTFILFLNIAAYLITIAGNFILGLSILGLICGIIFNLKDGWSAFKEMSWTWLLCIILVMLLVLAINFMPAIAAKLYSIVFTAAVWLWGLAKVVLFCDTDRFYI